MKCPKCNSIIDDKSKFCPNCGSEIFHKCPKCGQENPVTFRFCNQCGQQLLADEMPAKKDNVSVQEKKEKRPNNKQKTSFMLSLIAMAVLLLSIVLIFGLSFAPFKTDDFVPLANFTVIGYIVSTFKSGARQLVNKLQILTLFNAIVLICFLLEIIALTVFSLVICIKRFIKAVRSKTYCNFVPFVLPLYLSYISVAVFFNVFVHNDDILSKTTSGTVIFILIFVFLCIAYNIFVEEYIKEEHSLSKIIVRSVLLISTFVFGTIILFNLGGNTFNVLIKTIQEIYNGGYNVTGIYQLETGNIGLVSILLQNIRHAFLETKGSFIETIVFSIVALISTIASWTSSMLFLQKSVKQGLSKPVNYIIGIVVSLVIIINSILIQVFSNLANVSVNKLEFENSIISSVLGSDTSILCIIIGSLLLIVSVAGFIYEKSVIRKDRDNNEQKI